MHEGGVEELNRHCDPPSRLTDEPVVIRRFACPECLRLLDSEIRRADEPTLWDLRLEAP